MIEDKELGLKIADDDREAELYDIIESSKEDIKRLEKLIRLNNIIISGTEEEIKRRSKNGKGN